MPALKGGLDEVVHTKALEWWLHEHMGPAPLPLFLLGQ